MYLSQYPAALAEVAARDEAMVGDALNRCARAIANGAVVVGIHALDSADSHRSIEMAFSPEESALIFAAVERALKASR